MISDALDFVRNLHMADYFQPPVFNRKQTRPLIPLTFSLWSVCVLFGLCGGLHTYMLLQMNAWVEYDSNNMFCYAYIF